MSRRDFLRNSAAVAAAGTAPWLLPGTLTRASAATTPAELRNYRPNMRYRRLGRTNLMVSEISFGCGFHYGLDPLENLAEIREVLESALELGINYFDTAPDYGTEPFLAQLLPFRDDFLIATKVNRMSAAEVREDVEKSLRILKTSYLDVVQTHHQPQTDDWTGTLQALEQLNAMKAEGKVRFVGFTHHDYAALRTVLTQYPDLVDVILLLYDFLVFTDEAEDIISLAYSKDIGTVAMKVFQGADVSWEDRLAGWQSDEISWARLTALMDGSTTVAQACVKYVLQNPLLSSALLGIRSLGSLAENTAVFASP